jgi:outer membrane protein assembly factor BamB
MAEVLSVMQLIIRKMCRELLRVLVVSTFVFLPLGGNDAVADTTWTQTSQADFESGTLFQLDTSTSPGDVKLAKTGSNYVYAFRGNGTNEIWRYDTSANTWAALAGAPQNVGAGGALAYDGGNYIYALGGGNSKYFWRYSITANTWTSLTSAPLPVNEGGSLVCAGSSYVYALRGGSKSNFWRYSIASGTWSSRVGAPSAVKGGGALAYAGGDYIYALGGMATSFWRYSISGNSWSSQASAPSSVGDGGSLTSDGGNYIYAFKGANTVTFWRYNISANSWAAMADTPATPCVNGGGALTYDKSGRVYALRGNNQDDFWNYDVGANSWSVKADTPAAVAYGGALAFKGALYYGSGNLTSSTYDTGNAADFGSISWTATTPPGTSVKFQIATNNDSSTWFFKGPDGTPATYYTSSGAAIWSGHDSDRYIKYQALLGTVDTSVTPVLQDVSITYSQQIGLPTVTTSDATLVEESTATLHGTLTYDGGEPCQYRFEYGTVSGGPYPTQTGWTGSLATGQPFSVDITGLGKGTKYYFLAQAKNSAGTASGSEMEFLTKPEAPVDGTFTATQVNGTQIDLAWTKGEGAQKTMIRRKIGGYPVDRDDGDLVYFDIGTSFSDTGLSPSTTYYYRAWSEVTGSEQWSDGYLEVTATTGETPPEPPVPPVAVGGIVFPVDKAQVLAPWLGMLSVFSLFAGGGIVKIVRIRKRA